MPVNITGVQGTLKAMRKFDPDLAKQMNKQIKAAMLPIRDKARGYAPANSQMLSNWTNADAFGPQTRKYRAFPKYDQSETQKGIIYKQSANKVNRNGFQAVYFIANNSAGGAIYETAGRKSGITGKFTPNLGGDLVGTTQKLRGRAMFRTWQEDQGRAKGAILKAIFKSKEEFDIRVKAHSNG